MKRNSIIRQLFTAALALVISASFVNSASATPGTVDAKILNHFARTFATAENVTWKYTSDYAKASFTRDNQRMEVFYNDKDELICTATYLEMNKMPCAVLSTINDKYEGYKCNSAIKCVDADGNIKYYTEMENDKKTVVLQSDSDGFTTIFKSTRKK